MPSIREFSTRVAAIEFAHGGANDWMRADQFISSSMSTALWKHADDPVAAERDFGVVEPTGECDRCAFDSELNGRDASTFVHHVYVSNAPYVVHFRLCVPCCGHYAALADTAIRRTSVDGHRIDVRVGHADKDHMDG